MELKFDRRHIRRRHKKYIKKLEEWKYEILLIAQLLLEENEEKKAQGWATLYHTLDVVKDLWEKLREEI
ncbi:MAG: hypothetical protein QXQ36_07175 [Sulfolobales archaeon]